MKLHIAKDFSLPLDFVTQTQAILAKKRVGKSYTASVQAEELLKAQQQIVRSLGLIDYQSGRVVPKSLLFLEN